MTIRRTTRTAKTNGRTELLPATDEDTETFAFVPPSRTYQQHGIQIGSRFIPTSKWTPTKERAA